MSTRTDPDTNVDIPLTQNSAAQRHAGKVLFICLMIAVPFSIYFIFFALDDGHSVSGHGRVALGLAVILGFLSAFLFMGITFFSSRSGHDEQPNYREIVEANRNAEEKPKYPKPKHPIA